MAKVVDVIGDYKIIKTTRDYIVVNTKGEYEHHSHVKKEKTARMLIKLVTKKTLPTSRYLLEAAKRITLDERYRHSIELKQKKNKQKQYYHNPQKGTKH